MVKEKWITFSECPQTLINFCEFLKVVFVLVYVPKDSLDTCFIRPSMSLDKFVPLVESIRWFNFLETSSRRAIIVLFCPIIIVCTGSTYEVGFL